MSANLNTECNECGESIEYIGYYFPDTNEIELFSISGGIIINNIICPHCKEPNAVELIKTAFKQFLAEQEELAIEYKVEAQIEDKGGLL